MWNAQIWKHAQNIMPVLRHIEDHFAFGIGTAPISLRFPTMPWLDHDFTVENSIETSILADKSNIWSQVTHDLTIRKKRLSLPGSNH